MIYYKKIEEVIKHKQRANREYRFNKSPEYYLKNIKKLLNF